MGPFRRRYQNMNMVLRSGRSYARAMGGAALAGRITRRVANRFANSYTQTRRRRVTSGRGITNQYDRSTIYRKRSMPRWKRRQWKRFSNKVNAVSEKTLGSRTMLFNDQVDLLINLTTSAQQTQNLDAFALYPNANSGASIKNDIKTISDDTDLGTNGKCIFQSGIFDMTVRNTSFRQIDSDNSPITLEVDCYEITCGNTFQTAATTLVGCLAEGTTDTSTIPGQTNGLSISSRGATPWDVPSALSEYKIKIWKKTKFFIGENQTFTYQMRDPKRHVLDRQRMTIQGENMPGFTRFLLVVMKPTPGYIYQDINSDVARISIGITRKYLYKINQSSQDYDALDT